MHVANPLLACVSCEIPKCSTRWVVSRVIVKTADGITDRHLFKIEVLGRAKEHIHLSCSAHSKIRPDKIVYVFKNITARKVLRWKAPIKKKFCSGEF